MPIGRKHIYIYFCLEDAIDKTVLLGYLSAPAIFGLAFQWLGMACTLLRFSISVTDASGSKVVCSFLNSKIGTIK